MSRDSFRPNLHSPLRSNGGGIASTLYHTLARGDIVKLTSILASFLAIERANVAAYSMPWRKRLWCYRNGFYSYSGVIYGLNRHTVDAYLSDLQRRKAIPINEPHWKVAQLKLAFHEVLAHTHRHLLTDIVAVIQDGELYPVPSSAVEGTTFEELLDGVDAHSSLIAKPAGGWAGAGIFSIGRNENGFTVDGAPIRRSELVAKLRDLDGYLLDRAVEQADYASTIYPRSANTLRIITMIDPETRDPFIGAVIHRFGTDASQPVDNWSRGGICAGVDRETGQMGPATMKPKSGPPTFVETHPDTGARIDGTTIPSWSVVRDVVLSVADEYTHLWRYLGWDVVVTDDDGSITIIEANASPDVDLMQVHEPLLDDPRVRRFYRSHGVI